MGCRRHRLQRIRFEMPDRCVIKGISLVNQLHRPDLGDPILKLERLCRREDLKLAALFRRLINYVYQAESSVGNTMNDL